MFHPLDHAGLPPDRHDRHWHEQDVAPVDVRSLDPYALSRISAVRSLERAAAQFDRMLLGHLPDPDARPAVAALGDAAGRRSGHLRTLRYDAASPLETAADHERAVIDLLTWVARNEPEPRRSSAYRDQAWQHLDRLRSYAERGARAGYAWAGRTAAEADELAAGAPRPGAGPARPAAADRPDERPAPPAMASRPGPWPAGPVAGPPAAMTAPMSLLHRWAVDAARQHLTRHTRDVAGQPAGATPRSGWEHLVVHESAACYLYYSFLTSEDDRRLRALWELHLEMELAQLRAAGDLLRRYAGREPQEVVGPALVEPVVMEDTGRYLTRAGRSRRDEPADLVGELTAQHARVDRLLRRAAPEDRDPDRDAFAGLARLIAAHEVVEEELVHPLTRRLEPDGHLADRLQGEEERISDALGDAIRADRVGRLTDVAGALRDLVRGHARHEERDEFPRLRRDIPPDERRPMAAIVRAAVAAAAGGRRPGEGPAGLRGVWEAADTARDAVRSAA